MKSVTKTTIIYGLLLSSAEVMAVTASQLAFTSGDKTPNVKAQLLNLGQTSRFKTTPSSVKELMLIDGSVLTIGLDSEILIDLKNKKTHVELIQGSLRITAGSFQPALVTTSTCGNVITSEVINSSGFFESSIDTGFKAAMIYGQQINIKNNLKSIEIVKPGYAVEMPATSNDCRLGRPNRLAANELSRLLTQTETNILALGSLPVPSAGGPVSKAADKDAETVTTALADDDSSSSEATNNNSTTGEGTTDTGGADTGGDTDGGIDMGGTDPMPDPIPDPVPPLAIPDRTDDIQVADATSDGFGPGTTVDAPDLADSQASQSNGDWALAVQSATSVSSSFIQDESQTVVRAKGRTVNRVYSLTGSTQVLSGDPNVDPYALVDRVRGFSTPLPPDDITSDLSYLFSNDGTPASFFLDGTNQLYGQLSDIGSPVLFRNIRLPETAGVSQIYSNTLDTLTANEFVGQGGPFEGSTRYGLLTAGFHYDAGVIRAEDNFVFLQAVPGDMMTAGNFFFAAGDVDSRLNNALFTGPSFSVDQFHISSGISFTTDDTTQVYSASGVIENGIRAFGRSGTSFGLTLSDTGLLKVNQATEISDDQTALLHVDFALSGEGENQLSTISASIGQLSYDQTIFSDEICNTNSCTTESIEVSAEGQTVGSSQGNINYADGGAPVQREDVAFNSPFRLTAAGGGNPNLNRQGYAGYLVLENYDPTPQNSGDAAILGGTESTIGNSLGSTTSDVDYANLRLATANGNTGNGSAGDSYSVGTRSNITLNGWAAGLANREQQGSTGLTVTQIDSDLDPTNVSISTDAATNRVAATINLYNHTPLQLGGLTGDDSKGASAFVDNDNYAARTLDSDTGAQVAMVSSGLIEAGLPAGAIPDYDYIQWGFFFGDTAVSTTSREHVHLGSWVAGDVTALADLPTTGSATYSGHTIGNVFSGGENYTAIGTYNNSWDFGSRRGTATMSFDNTSYSGDTQIRDNSIVFDGVVNGGGRTGALHGNFVQGGGDPVAGVTGRFSIQNTAGNADYRASGTFAGEKD